MNKQTRMMTLNRQISIILHLSAGKTIVLRAMRDFPSYMMELIICKATDYQIINIENEKT